MPRIRNKSVCLGDGMEEQEETFPYVMISPVKGLPKGYKWSQGEKHVNNGARKKRSDRRTVVFLPIGDDLYMNVFPIYVAISNKPDEDDSYTEMKFDRVTIGCYRHGYACVIRGYRQYTAIQLTRWFDSFVAGEIFKFWKSQGLRNGFVEPMMRDLKDVIKCQQSETSITQ